MSKQSHLSRLAHVVQGPARQQVAGRAGIAGPCFRESGTSKPLELLPWMSAAWTPRAELPSADKVKERLSQTFEQSVPGISALPSDAAPSVSFENLATPLMAFRDAALKDGQSVPQIKATLLERLTAGLSEAEDLMQRLGSFIKGSEPLLKQSTGVFSAFVVGWLTESLFCGDDESWREFALKSGAVALGSSLAFASGVAPFWIGAAVLGGYVTATAKRHRILEKTGEVLIRAEKLVTTLAELAILICKILSSGHKEGGLAESRF